jgi:hypothetical protein
MLFLRSCCAYLAASDKTNENSQGSNAAQYQNKRVKGYSDMGLCTGINYHASKRLVTTVTCRK